jgi:hypothetical protein
MSPQRLLRNDIYGPDSIARMRQAFDIVWERMAPGVTKNGAEAARAKLADCILAHADQAQSAEELAEQVMSVMFAEPAELGERSTGTTSSGHASAGS